MSTTPKLNQLIADSANLQRMYRSYQNPGSFNPDPTVETEATTIIELAKSASLITRLSLAAQVLEQININELDMAGLIYCLARSFPRGTVEQSEPALVAQVKDQFSFFSRRVEARELTQQFMGKLAAGLVTAARKQIAQEINNGAMSVNWALDGAVYQSLVPTELRDNDLKVAIKNWVAIAPMQRMGRITQEARDFMAANAGNLSPLAAYYMECLEERKAAQTATDNRRPNIGGRSSTRPFQAGFRAKASTR